MEYLLVYIDDVIIHSNIVQNHIRHVDELLKVLAEAGFNIKMSTFTFFRDKVEYPKNIIRPGKL